ncbi:MAG TPA: hypothetical protein VLD38_06870 [Nitrosopumilaceae archaeon]|nr:hypothetical protein [Nitrosopumilaceae archaeon]
MVLVLAVSSIYYVSAQSDIVNTTNKKDPTDKIPKFDDMLGPTITSTLTGLSLAGASFLLNLGKNANAIDSDHVHRARKFFIKAFFMFLICTILLFTFDFLEIIDERDIVLLTIWDVIITYSLFGIGAFYLAKAARELYVAYGK